MDSTSEAQQEVHIEPIVDPPTVRKAKKRVPQANVDRFWNKFNTAFPGKVHTILPQNVYALAKAAKTPRGTVHSQRAGKSYVEAAAECRAAVEKISTECRRVNLKYRDPHFDIEWDLKFKKRDCLDGLWDEDIDMTPRSVKRISVSQVKLLSLMASLTHSAVHCSIYSMTQSFIKKAPLPVMYDKGIMVIVGSCLHSARLGTRRISSTKFVFIVMRQWVFTVLYFTEARLINSVSHHHD